MPSGLHHLLMLSSSQTIASELRAILEPEGLTVAVAASVAEARNYLAENGLPLGLLIDLEGLEEGLDFCDEMTVFAGLPVIVLGPESLDKIAIMEAFTCADTYLRPNESTPKELATRFTRLFTRLSPAQNLIGHKIALANNVVVNFPQKTAIIDGQNIELTPTEIALLHVLAVHQGEMVDNQTLIERVWRGAAEGNSNSLRVHMHRLRKKLKWKKGQQQAVVRTVRGVGYLLQTSA